MKSKVLFLSALIPLVLSAATAEEWPAWRGPRGDGTSTETALPVRWSATENVLWKTPIPGKGHSSPIVWGDRIFLTTCVEGEQKRMLLCLDAGSGKVLWKRTVLTARLERKNKLNSYASSTPATDGRRVWVSFMAYPKVWVVCYDVEGKELWRRSPGELHAVHGFCSSVIPYKDWVIVNADQDAPDNKRAYIAAMDKATGKERWRINRPNRIRSYSPPFITAAAGRDQMVLSGSRCVASYDPDTGKQIWIIDGPTDQFVASMVYTDGMFCMTGGFPTRHILGIRPDGTGNVTKTHVVWHETTNPSYVPSPIAHDKHFFVVSDKGVAQCLEARTGKRRWMEQLGKHHSASPISAAGRLYFPDDNGVTWILQAGATFKVLAKNDIGEPTVASPAVSPGRIYLRARNTLYCIGAENK